VAFRFFLAIILSALFFRLANAQSPEAIAEQGVALLQEGKIAEAKSYFSRALKVNPRLYEVHNLMGVALEQAGDHQSAAKSFRRAIQIEKNYAPAHRNLGLNAAEARDYATAATEFRQALQLDAKQDNVDQLRFDLALALYRCGQFEESLRTLDDLSETGSRDAAYYALSGSAKRELGNFAPALIDLNKAVSLDPESDDYLYDLAIALIQAGKAEQALNELDARISRCKNCASLYAARGVACYATGRNDESAKNYQTALRLEPGAADLHVALGDLYSAAGAFERAGDEFDAAVELDSTNIAYRVKQGRNWVQLQQPVKAEALFRNLLLKDPTNFDANFYLGKLASDRGDVASAIRNLKAAVQKQPGNSAALYQLALAYRKAGLPNEAAKTMERFLKLRNSVGEEPSK
jgi:tetratricopeptide (TPR) repeat protein